jgi:CRISPR-associated protein Cas1
VRNRVLEFSRSPTKLRVAHRQLIIAQENAPQRSIPISDIAVLIAAHPQISYTQAVLAELMAAGGAFVTCDAARMPVGMLLPLDSHSTQTQRFRDQFEITQPRRKRLWQQIIQAKIRMQAQLLRERTGDDHGLEVLIAQVQSGDPRNVEAWAAKRYWHALFGLEFRRDREADNVNALLNYGYAILRAATARSICAAGLHPSIGLHHRNKYNSWCLADDLMEPYRPLVDRIAAQIFESMSAHVELDSDVRAAILRGLVGMARIDDEVRTLFDALTLSSQSLYTAIGSATDRLVFPTEFLDAPQ